MKVEFSAAPITDFWVFPVVVVIGSRRMVFVGWLWWGASIVWKKRDPR